ncbi:MAG: PAS domain S-box protein [Aphanothece sp. CMT-3BRIN-NPC111]|jgi:PAS domain S-box-containing protein|nr:PAS domain S-box protein [Aphanothece sp. CMT-3BRIN-NPC111]
MMIATYDISLVILSVAIAIIASYSAIDLAGRVKAAQGPSRNLWLVGGATAMGIGIWSMHFVGMLAYKLPIPIGYNLPIVLVSILVAIVASFAALFIVSRESMGWQPLLGGAIFMGLGIASMHYIGMAGMQMQAVNEAMPVALVVSYDPKLVALSIAIAIGASLAAMWLAFKLRKSNTPSAIGQKLGSAVLMGAAIAGMHYTGMAAASMQPTNQVIENSSSILGTSRLAVAVGAGTLVILGLTLLTSLFDRRIEQERLLLAAIVESSHDATIGTSVNGIIQTWNSAAARLLGYSATEVKGRHISLLVPPTAPEEIDQIVEQSNPGETIENFDTVWVTKDGKKIDVSLTISLIKNAEGEISGVATIARDITERKRIARELEKEQQFQKAVLENVSDGIVACDTQGNLTIFNRAAREFHDLSQSPLSASAWAPNYDLYFADGETPMAKEDIPLFKALQGEKFHNLEMAIAPKQGIKRTLLASGEAIFDSQGNKLGAVVSMHDTTDRKIALKFLENAKEQLEIKVRERTAQLDQANQKLQAEIAQRIQAKQALAAVNKELRKNELRFRSLVANIPGVIYRCLCDSNWTMDFISDAIGDISGYPASDFLNNRVRNYASIIHPDDRERIKQLVNEALDQKTPYILEYRIIHAEGSIRWVYEKGRAYFGLNGNAAWLDGAIFDITERQQAEEELRDMRVALENTVEGISRLDTQGRYISCNWPYANKLGYEPEEMIGKEWSLTAHPEDMEKMSAAYQQMLTDGKAEVEARAICKDGAVFYKQVAMSKAYNRQGQFAGHYCFMNDITERKLAEEKLKESEERFRLLVEGVKEYAIIMLDADGYVASWNGAAERIKGYKAEEIVGQHFSRFLTPEDLKRGKPKHELKVAETEGKYEEEGWRLRKGGSRFWANVLINPLRDEAGNIRGFSKVTRDITDRKLAEEKLKESEERFRLLIEGVKDYAIFMLDNQGYVISWNAGAERIHGYKAEEIIGQHFLHFYFEEDVQSGHPDYALIVAEAQSRYEEEGWRLRKDGSVFWANVLITALRDEAGSIRGFSNVTRDITARKQDEQRLRKWGDIFQHTGQGLIIANPGSKVLEMMNPALASMHGYTVEELTGRPFPSIIASECLAETLEHIELSYNKEQYAFETKHIRKDGTVFPVLVDITNVMDNAGKIAYSIINVQDITQRQQAEAEIRNALAKERELGELKTRFISMTSHEFRTPLATILSSTELLEHYSHKLKEQEKQDLFRQIERATQRMTQLLEDVLAINKAEAGKLQFNPAPLNIENLCRDIVNEMQLNAGDRHEIVFIKLGECINTVMDEKLLQHILSNLLSNAIKYSPQGGRVEFELVCEDKQAIFKIKDHGIGIPIEDREKLFESFHRAQNVGNIPGTGLGLSIVKRMVDLHGGNIKVASKVGVGTTFIVNIPLNVGVKTNDQDFSN